MQKLIILDRDGVINYDSPSYIKSPLEWQAIPGSLEAIALLNKKSFKVAVATNQSGVGRWYYDLETLMAIHKKLFSQLAAVNGTIDKLVYCPHVSEDNCNCRKPRTGMLLEIFAFFNINIKEDLVYFVGDSVKDIQVAIATNCQPILVQTGNGYTTKQDPRYINSIPVFADLLAFAKSL